MSHEQSETFETPYGWTNTYGHDLTDGVSSTPLPLTPQFGFERRFYETEPQAITALAWRFRLGGAPQPDRGQSPPTGITNTYKPHPAAAAIGRLLDLLSDERTDAVTAPGMLLAPGAAKLPFALLGMLKGIKGASRAELAGLEQAKALKAEGKPTWDKTAWEQGPGGDWFRHIDGPNPTIDMAKAQTHNRLANFYHDPGLFDAYPQLADASVKRLGEDKMGSNVGAFDPKKRFIYLNTESDANRDPARLRSTLAHELQHAIQRIENAPGGANVEEFLPPFHGLREDILGDRWVDLLPQLRDLEGAPLDGKRVAGLINYTLPDPRLPGFSPTTYTPTDILYLTRLEAALSNAHPEIAALLRHTRDHQTDMFNAAGKYTRHAGEVQARLADTRMTQLSPRERRWTSPRDAQDVPYAEQLIRRFTDDPYRLPPDRSPARSERP